MKSAFKKNIKRLFIAAILIVVATILFLTIVYELRYEAPLPAAPVTEFSFIHSDEKKVNELVLLPVPKEIKKGEGTFVMPESIRISAPADLRVMVNNAVSKYLGSESISVSGNEMLRVQLDETLPPEGYRLVIQPDGVEIYFADLPGLYYGIMTLGQVYKQSNGSLPVLSITDWPDLKVRGAMIDISRDKIPTMETLTEIIDMLALLRYNHLQLYVEGFSFSYPSFQGTWEPTETPVTGEEMQALDQYAEMHMIDLVPNQNMLGHMSKWLATDQFSHLAECPDGYLIMGLFEYNSTLNVSNPESLELVKQMTDDMLPNFSSDYFNANLDEPFELGKCKTEELAAEKGGAGYLYLDFLKEINTYVKENHGKQMMIWADIVAKHPEIIPEIPQDVILIEWGYESIHPFDEHVARISDAGLPFLVAPGTSSWTTFTGRTDNMMENINVSIEAALAHGGMGMLLTDWGDMGHWQYWPVSWAPLTYGAAVSWNYDSRDALPLVKFLNQFIFQDRAKEMGALVLDLGRYNQFEEYKMVNMTTTMQTYMFGIMDPVMQDAVQNRLVRELPNLMQVSDDVINEIIDRFDNPEAYNHQAILDYTSILRERLRESNMDRHDAGLIIDEMENAIRMIHLGAKTRHYAQWMREYTPGQKLELLDEMSLLVTEIINEHERLWLVRNRRGGLERSLGGFMDLKASIKSEIERQNSNAIFRFFRNFGDKLIAAAAALYIDR